MKNWTRPTQVNSSNKKWLVKFGFNVAYSGSPADLAKELTQVYIKPIKTTNNELIYFLGIAFCIFLTVFDLFGHLSE